jgi:hypothetical protein
MINKRVLICLLAVCISGFSLPSADRAQVPEVEQISILQLIATPEAFNGKEVQVIGFLRLEFEGNVLYLHEEDYTHHIYKNGLWLRPNAKMKANTDKLNLHYVIIKGRFNARDKGHMGLGSGTITEIRGADIWPNPPNSREVPPS